MLVGLDGNKSLSLSVDSKNITKHVSSPVLLTSSFSLDDATEGRFWTACQPRQLQATC